MRYDASHYAVLCLCATASLSIPASDLPSTYESVALHRRDAIVTGGEELRILPLGDSITRGEGSSDGNGYRLALYDWLQLENDLEYIGRLTTGTMVDNHHEGYGGYPIGAIEALVTSHYPEQPSLVLLMAGTNDVIRKHNLSTSSAALDKLINKVVNAYPDAVVLVAEITPLLEPKREVRRLEFNSAIPGVIKKYADDGKHIAVVDMGRVKPEYINATDGIHPVDEGYRLIADAWYGAILAARYRGWLGELTFATHNTLGGWISDSTSTLDIINYGAMSLVALFAVRKLVNIAIRKYGTRLSL